MFNSFINGLSRTLRLLIEAICVQMLMSGEAKKYRDDFPDVACGKFCVIMKSGYLRRSFLGLPFQNEVNTGFGILVKVFIDATVAFNDGEPLTETNAKSAEVRAAKESAIGILEDTFITIKAPEDELKRGFRFWDAVRLSLPLLSRTLTFSFLAVYRCEAYRPFDGFRHHPRALSRIREDRQVAEALPTRRNVGIRRMKPCVGENET